MTTPMQSKKTLDLYPIDYPFETLFARITAQEPKLLLDPDFQRKYKWDKDGWSRASKFIESCLMRIPLPSCYFAEDDSSRQIVIDGVQRLTTIVRFMSNDFALEGLTVFRELEGLRFSEIGEHARDLESTTIRCIVLRKNNPKNIVREIFSRLNQGAVALSDQEVRHAMYPGPFDRLLSELGKLEPIAKFGMGPSSDEKKRDAREAEEQVLRFFAFRREGIDGYDGRLREFLDNKMAKCQMLPNNEMDNMRSDFVQALDHCLLVFGENEVFVDTSKRRKRQSMVYYDLIMQTLADIPAEVIKRKRDRIRKSFADLCASSEFQRTLSGGLANRASILRRHAIWSPLLKKALEP